MPPIQNITKIRPVWAELSHVDIRTDMKIIARFENQRWRLKRGHIVRPFHCRKLEIMLALIEIQRCFFQSFVCFSLRLPQEIQGESCNVRTSHAVWCLPSSVCPSMAVATFLQAVTTQLYHSWSLAVKIHPQYWKILSPWCVVRIICKGEFILGFPLSNSV